MRIIMCSPALWEVNCLDVRRLEEQRRNKSEAGLWSDNVIWDIHVQLKQINPLIACSCSALGVTEIRLLVLRDAQRGTTSRRGLHLAGAQECLLSSHTDDDFFIWHWRWLLHLHGAVTWLLSACSIQPSSQQSWGGWKSDGWGRHGSSEQRISSGGLFYFA